MSNARCEAGSQLGEMVTGHAMVTMLALGHRLGLLEPLSDQALSAGALAATTGTSPRYVEEWLRSLVAGGVVAVADERFRLAEGYRPLLAGASATNFAPTLEMIARLSENLSEICERFRDGQGISPATLARRAGNALGEPRRRHYDEQFVSGYLGVIPGLHDRLRGGASVLDLGCGTGQTARLLAETFPACRVLGVDVVEDAIAHARAEHAGVPAVEFAVGDAADIRGKFDVVLAVDVIHDLAEPAKVLRAVHECLDQGLLVMIDTGFSSELNDHIDDPVAAASAATSVLYCLPVSLHHQHGLGAGLGAMWGYQRAEAMLRHAGFTRVARYPAPRPQNAIYSASG